MGGKGTVISNSGGQGKWFIRIVEVVDGAPESAIQGVFEEIVDTNYTTGATYAVTFNQDGDGNPVYTLSGSAGYATGKVSSDGKQLKITHVGPYPDSVLNQTFDLVKGSYNDIVAGESISYANHTTAKINQTLNCQLIMGPEDTVQGVDYVGASGTDQGTGL